MDEVTRESNVSLDKTIITAPSTTKNLSCPLLNHPVPVQLLACQPLNYCFRESLCILKIECFKRFTFRKHVQAQANQTPKASPTINESMRPLPNDSIPKSSCVEALQTADSRETHRRKSGCYII